MNELIDRGAFVFGIARRIEMLKELSNNYPQKFASFYKCDITQQDDVNNIMNIINENNFVPDVVILNAGVNQTDSIPDFNYKEFNININTNLLGALIWVKPFLSIMKNKNNGQIIAISSMSAYLAQSNGVGYSSSKAALTMAFQCLNKIYKQKGINFNVFNLGPVNTDMWKKGKFPFLLSDKKVARKIIYSFGSKRSTINYPAYLVFIAKVLNFIPNIHILK